MEGTRGRAKYLHSQSHRRFSAVLPNSAPMKKTV